MYIPDRVIVRKLQEYDPHLFVEWNNRHKWFEVWRHMAHGRRLITPVTRSIYEEKGPRAFTPLDERILMWVYLADSWRHKDVKDLAKLQEDRWRECIKLSKMSQRADLRNRAKDAWNLANARFTTKHAPKNGRPTFTGCKPGANWIAPDSQARTSRRLFSRSKQNALAYNFKKI